MENQILLTEIRRNVCTLTLNRPQKKNSLSPELVDKLLQTLKELAADDGVRAVIIRGAGDQAFCSGYDIGSLPTVDTPDVDAQLKTLSPVEALFRAVVHYPFPVIAMLNGLAFGAGCELSVCCDIRIAADTVRMGMPPARLGLVYPWSGLQRFIQVIGLRNTREIFFSARTYEGQRLKELGLVDYLVAPDELESFTCRMAGDIAANAPLALKGTKQVLNLLLESVALDPEKLARAEAITREAFLSEDLNEGRRAFLEKRKPRFKGR